MSYIVRVIGFEAYWTGNTESLWSNMLTEAKQFTTEEEALGVVNSGTNMEVVSYETANKSAGTFMTPLDFISSESSTTEIKVEDDDFEEIKKVECEVLD